MMSVRVCVCVGVRVHVCGCVCMYLFNLHEDQTSQQDSEKNLKCLMLWGHLVTIKSQ